MRSYSCPKNKDLQEFLHKQAIHFEKADITRTYLIVGEEGDIYAYFSLSTKEVIIDSDFLGVSKSAIKKMHLSDNNALRAFLIGQIGKNFAIPNNPLNLQLILDEIYQLLYQAQQIIGSRAVILECENNPRLIQHYIKHDFKVIHVKSHHDGLITMYKFITS